jgi:hypothetical protein
MSVVLEYNKDLLWESDWNGYEVGYPSSNVVGLYRLANSSVYFYIDVINNKILEAWEGEEEE